MGSAGLIWPGAETSLAKMCAEKISHTAFLQ